MRYAKLNCIRFSYCYLQQHLSIELFCYRTTGRGQKGSMNKSYDSVLLSGRFLGIFSLVFFGTSHDVRGPCGVVHGRARFFENNIVPLKWGK